MPRYMLTGLNDANDCREVVQTCGVGDGKLLGYEAIYGTGGAVVSLTPTKPIKGKMLPSAASASPSRIRVLRPSWTRRTVAASSRLIERSVITPFSRITSGCFSSAWRTLPCRRVRRH